METVKKYLKTIEEVSDALAAGKVVYNKFKTSFRKDKNKFIVKTFSDGTETLNSSLAFDENRFYVLEPKPLEVKLWHLYEDEGGRRILISEKQKTIYPFVGINLNTGCFYHYNDEGKSIEPVINSKLVKELADLSQYFEKGNNNAKND